MLRSGARAYRGSAKIKLFLIAAFVGLITFPISLPLYLIATFILGAHVTRLPVAAWPLIPFAFLLHHATYLGGILWGLRGSGGGFRRDG